jgi:hypothetical protein
MACCASASGTRPDKLGGRARPPVRPSRRRSAVCRGARLRPQVARIIRRATEPKRNEMVLLVADLLPLKCVRVCLWRPNSLGPPSDADRSANCRLRDLWGSAHLASWPGQATRSARLARPAPPREPERQRHPPSASVRQRRRSSPANPHDGGPASLHLPRHRTDRCAISPLQCLLAALGCRLARTTPAGGR